MLEMINIAIKTIFIENMVFAFFLGMCSYLAISKNFNAAFGLGLAVIVVQLVTIPLNWFLKTYFLEPGALSWLHPSFASVDLSFLTFLVFIATIASSVQLVEMVVERFFPALYTALGIFLPLITVNCAILGGSLFMDERDYSFGESVFFALGAGIGWFLAIVLFAAIRQKVRYSNVVKPLRGLGLAFIITALLGIAFMGFAGIKL